MNKESKEEKFAITFAYLYKTYLEMTELSIKMALTQIECHEQIAKNHYRKNHLKLLRKNIKNGKKNKKN